MSQARESGWTVAALPRPRRFDVIVIGGGQAGLSVGYFLKRKQVSFTILDASARVGDSWRKRWDSLRLFTPAKFDALAGMPFPAPAETFPTRDQMADYLEAYAKRFQLPIQSATEVTSLTRRNGRFVVVTNTGELEADQVVVAMASYQRPALPAFAAELRKDIVQLHSSEYKNPEQLAEGGVLIAGAGNSGSEIAIELARRGHEVWMAGRDTGAVPFRMAGFWGRLFLGWLVLRFVFHRLMTIRTPMGRKLRSVALHQGGPLIRVRWKELTAAGVRRAPRVTGASQGAPLLADGRALDVANVVWCTGFHPGFSWIELPIFDERREPIHDGGVVTNEPGLYFVGLHFLYAMSSTMIHGVGRDAARIADAVAARHAAN